MRSLDPTAVGRSAKQLGRTVFSRSGMWGGQTLLARLRPILILEATLIPGDLLNGIKGWFKQKGITNSEEKGAILRKMLDKGFTPQEQSRLAARVFGYDPLMIPAYTRFCAGISPLDAWCFLCPHVGVASDRLKTLFLGVSAHLNNEEKGILLHSLIVGGDFSQHAGKAKFAASLFEGDQRREVVYGMFVKSFNFPNYDGQIFKAIAKELPLEEQGLLLAQVIKPRKDYQQYLRDFLLPAIAHLSTAEDKVVVLRAAFREVETEKAARITKFFSKKDFSVFRDLAAQLETALLAGPDVSPETQAAFWQVYNAS